MSADQQARWAGLVGKRVLVRDAGPIREVFVAEVTPGGHVRLVFLPEVQGPPSVDWYGPKDWRVLEVLG